MSVLRNQKFCGSHPNLRLFTHPTQTANPFQIRKPDGSNNSSLSTYEEIFAVDPSGSVVTHGHITASGNISSSGDVIASLGTGSFGAVKLLDDKNVKYEEINIEEINMSRQELQNITGGSTVPQIIINGKSIGGFDNLVTLNTNGKLNTLLNI